LGIWGLLLAPYFEGYLIPPVLNSDVTFLTLQAKKGNSFFVRGLMRENGDGLCAEFRGNRPKKKDSQQ
jgi:hypothetical protein